MHDEERKGKIGDPLSHVLTTMGGDRYTVRYCPDCAVLFKEPLDPEPEHPLMKIMRDDALRRV